MIRIKFKLIIQCCECFEGGWSWRRGRSSCSCSASAPPSSWPRWARSRAASSAPTSWTCAGPTSPAGVATQGRGRMAMLQHWRMKSRISHFQYISDKVSLHKICVDKQLSIYPIYSIILYRRNRILSTIPKLLYIRIYFYLTKFCSFGPYWNFDILYLLYYNWFYLVSGSFLSGFYCICLI